eukprot:274456-Prymnesium_polylepis.1
MLTVSVTGELPMTHLERSDSSATVEACTSNFHRVSSRVRYEPLTDAPLAAPYRARRAASSEPGCRRAPSRSAASGAWSA